MANLHDRREVPSGAAARATETQQLTRVNRPTTSTLLLWVRAFIVGFAVIAVYLQLPYGRADNGDFTRVMTWFVESPVGFAENWPTDPVQYERRFFNFYIPEWRLTFPLDSVVMSSAVLLWAPGVALNLAFSQDVLYLPLMSLPARAVLLAVLLLIFLWIDRRLAAPGQRLLATVAIGLPYAAVVTSTDYVTFLNSFYQESASFVFLFAFLAAAIALRVVGWNVRLAAVALVFLFLVASAKASNVYWPFIGIAAVVPPLVTPKARVAAIVGGVVVASVLAGAALQMTMGANRPTVLTYHSIFYGVLPLSDQPEAHLVRIAAADAEHCIGNPAYTEVGGACWHDYGDELSRRDLLLIVAHEPLLAPKAVLTAASGMQDVSIRYLAIHPEGRVDGEAPSPILNAWSTLKQNAFPRGGVLVAILAAYAITFAWAARRGGLVSDLAVVGLITTAAVGIDIAVAFFGDGAQELAKHLFVANLAFDIATIAIFGIAVAAAARRADRAARRYESVSPSSQAAEQGHEPDERARAPHLTRLGVSQRGF